MVGVGDSSRGLQVAYAPHWNNALTRVARALQDWSPAMKALSEDFREIESEQFATEGGYSGGWAPLSRAYSAWKEYAHPGAPILVLSGRLKGAALKPKVAVTSAGLKIEVSDPKIRYHQFGTSRMPARPVVVFNAIVAARWTELLAQFLKSRVETLPGSGFQRPRGSV